MQFVIFKLGEENFAVDTDKILSINNMMPITNVPKAPNYIKGLINLRGSIKSLLDINLLLNIHSSIEPQNIIILKVNEEEIGIAVDDVEEVLDVDEKKIQRLENSNNEDYIKGIVDLESKLLTLIDIEKLLNK